jgi:hypothetical protein
VDTSGDSDNVNETKGTQASNVTNASATTPTEVNGEVTSTVESDNGSRDGQTPPPQDPPLVENSSSSSSGEIDEMEKIHVQNFCYRGNPSTLGQRFSDWLELFDLGSEANGIKDGQQKAYFLTKVGEELLDVYRSKRKDENMLYADIRKMLVEHTKPKTVVFTERAIFRRARRHEGESANDFATRLRTLARYCGYKDTQLEEEILQQFVSGIGSHAVEMKICSLESPTLEKAIEIAITVETLDANVKGLHGPTDREIGRRAISWLAEEDEAEEKSVNHIGRGLRNSGQEQRGGQRDGPPSNRQSSSSQQPGQQSCGNCGYAKHQSADQCPAFGRTCHICQKVNHFSRVCRSEKAKQMENGTAGAFGGAGASQARKPGTAEPPPKKFHQISSEENKKFEVDEQQYSEYIRYVKASQWMGIIRPKGRLNGGPRRTYHLLGTEIHCIVDTGAPINVIDEATLKTINPQPKLETCKTLYFPYGEEIAKPIPVIGQFVANIHYKGRSLPASFVVVSGQEELLMCYHTAVELGIISMDNDRANANDSLSSTSGAPESLMEKLGEGLETSKTSAKEKQEALRESLRRHDDAADSTTGVSSNRFLLSPDSSSEIPSVVTETSEQQERLRQMALELFRQQEVGDPGAKARGESGSPESSISKRREEAAPVGYKQSGRARYKGNQPQDVETNSVQQKEEPQAEGLNASTKRPPRRPPATKSPERHRIELEDAAYAKRAVNPPTRAPERLKDKRSPADEQQSLACNHHGSQAAPQIFFKEEGRCGVA